jgi:hypothetical protein
VTQFCYKHPLYLNLMKQHCLLQCLSLTKPTVTKGQEINRSLELIKFPCCYSSILENKLRNEYSFFPILDELKNYFKSTSIHILLNHHHRHLLLTLDSQFPALSKDLQCSIASNTTPAVPASDNTSMLPCRFLHPPNLRRV